MPEVDLGNVMGPQGLPGSPGADGQDGRQGDQGEPGKDASINGVNALQIDVGAGLNASMNGNTYSISMEDETHQAAQRAAAGGALDQQLQRKVNPNLLDNWYFIDPIDTKEGRLVPPGATADLDGDASVVITTDKYYTVTKINGGYAQFVYSDGKTYNTLLSGCVRGYKAYEQGINRWMDYYDFGVMLVTTTGLRCIGTDNDFWLTQFIHQPLAGKTVTASVLLADGSLFTMTSQFPSNGKVGLAFNEDINGYLVADFPDYPAMTFMTAHTYDVTFVAVKLELGDQQTLAHQDADGNWVLNEIPNKAEQLAICSQYDPSSGAYKGILLTGYGFGGEATQTVQADSANETHSTFCAKLDAVLETLPEKLK